MSNINSNSSLITNQITNYHYNNSNFIKEKNHSIYIAKV